MKLDRLHVSPGSAARCRTPREFGIVWDTPRKASRSRSLVHSRCRISGRHRFTGTKRRISVVQWMPARRRTLRLAHSDPRKATCAARGTCRRWCCNKDGPRRRTMWQSWMRLRGVRVSSARMEPTAMPRKLPLLEKRTRTARAHVQSISLSRPTGASHPPTEANALTKKVPAGHSVLSMRPNRPPPNMLRNPAAVLTMFHSTAAARGCCGPLSWQ